MSRGVSVKSPENVALAQQLRAEGMTYREIGERFGVKGSTAMDWVNDPQGVALRARKNACAASCVDCGRPTSGGEGRKDEPRCASCAQRNAKIWTREAIILAIQEWAAEYGEPPAVTDWNPWAARHEKCDEPRARRHERDMAAGKYPGFTAPIAEFGSWNSAIEAAGFTPRAAHGGDGNEHRTRAMRAKAAA